MNNQDLDLSSMPRSDDENEEEETQPQRPLNIPGSGIRLSKDFLTDLLVMQRQYAELRSMAKREKLSQDQLHGALSWGLERLLNKRCPELLDKGRQFFEKCDTFFRKLNQVEEKNVKVYTNSELYSNKKEEEKKTEDLNRNEAPTQKIEKIPPSPSPLEMEKEKTEKKVIENPLQINDELRQKLISNLPKIEIPVVAVQPKREEAQQPRQARQEELRQPQIRTVHQRLNSMTYHVIWENKSAFDVQDRKVTKMYNDDYRKICSTEPFKNQFSYNIKFKILKLGTIALGIVPEQNKGGLFIDDRYCDALKFITFFNGDGGKLKLNGQEIESGRSLAMREGDQLEMTFDPKTMKVSFKTTRLRQKIQIDISHYKGLVLYLYLEMKQKNTCIQFL